MCVPLPYENMIDSPEQPVAHSYASGMVLCVSKKRRRLGLSDIHIIDGIENAV